jgi:hypothetical protein
MDLFNSSSSQASGEALTALIRADLSRDTYLNYETWSTYEQSLSDKRLQSVLQQRGAAASFTFPASRVQPVRPIAAASRGFMTMLNTRGFSTNQNIKYSEEYLQKQQEQQTQKKGKFFEFIKKIDTLDAQPEAAKVKSDYDMDDLDISFDKISKTSSAATA